MTISRHQLSAGHEALTVNVWEPHYLENWEAGRKSPFFPSQILARERVSKIAPKFVDVIERAVGVLCAHLAANNSAAFRLTREFVREVVCWNLLDVEGDVA
jgi:hypothetical protein